MTRLEQVRDALQKYMDIEKASVFFSELGYNTMKPLPAPELDRLPDRPRELLKSFHLIADYAQHFRIYHAQLAHDRLRRTDIRMVLEAFYRHFPQLNALFVFTTAETPYRDFAFVSPERFKDHRDPMKVHLWLRTMVVNRAEPFRTDLEVLDTIRLESPLSSEEIWQKHKKAFSVERVTERFFEDYQSIFSRICDHLNRAHKDPKWAHDYAHLLLNRIMFLYFIQRKGWLLGEDGTPDRHFMRHLWEAYKEAREDGRTKPNTFNRDWLYLLFFETFNNPPQKRPKYSKCFPRWLVNALSQAPFLNGGLFAKSQLDDRLFNPLPDEVFELLFDYWVDGAFPGFFERYNFTIVESGRFDEEVAVDPEMMGKVYERLVNITFEGISEEDRRSTTGIFYTPRTEIDLMCRLALTDYLTNHLGENRRSLITEWVFAYTSEEKKEVDKSITQQGLWQSLDELVRSVTICDPAVGSGSFLIGMLLVLDDLQERCQRALGITETPYERRRRIIGEQLYGVDVMEWAVRVAELRLWLQLVVETELDPAELKSRPLLPNLSFKVRHGDSLLQEVGELNFSRFRRRELPVPSYLKDKLAALKDKKQRFYSGGNRELTEDALRQEEVQVFREILLYRLRVLEREISQEERGIRETKRSYQPSIPGLPTTPGSTSETACQQEKLEERLEQKREEQRRVREALEALRNPQEIPFIWDVAFVEIFEGEKGGFDIVIGNPPYVRQEKISDPLGRHSRDEYLNRVRATLSDLYPAFFRGRFLSRRSDYYVYFYLHGLSLINGKGSFCFVTSNSWLDVDFGKDLQEFLLKHSDIRAIIDNRARRSFAQADVNTVIVLLAPPTREPLSREEMAQRQVRFVTFKVPFEEALSSVIFLEIAEAEERRDLPEFRVLVKDQWRLLLEGSEQPEEETLFHVPCYIGDKWGGKYLRAPDIFFTILEKGQGKLVRLGEIAEVRFGIKTGANEFFYLQPVGRTVKEVAELAERNPHALIRVRNGAGWEGEIEVAWLRPVIKSPREIRRLTVRLEDISNLVFMPPDDVRAVIQKMQENKKWRQVHSYLAQHYPEARVYIQWGERRGYDRNETCARRFLWWVVPEEKGNTFWGKELRERIGVFSSETLMYTDCRLYVAETPPEIRALSNSALSILVDETKARNYGGGGGPRSVMVYEVQAIEIPRPTILTDAQRQHLLSAFEQLAQREVRSIFEELGFQLCRQRGCQHLEHPYEFVDPNALMLEQVQRASPDRFELDSVVFDALGLTDEERLAVYRAVAELVKSRLVKARSV